MCWTTAIGTAGAFVKLEDGIEGLVHISEFPSPDDLRKTLELGRTYKFKITLFEPANHRMTLSYKQVDSNAK